MAWWGQQARGPGTATEYSCVWAHYTAQACHSVDYSVNGPSAVLQSVIPGLGIYSSLSYPFIIHFPVSAHPREDKLISS